MYHFRVGSVEKAIWLVCLWLVISGCATLSGSGKLDAFEEVSKNYRFAMLKSEYELAANLALVETRSNLPELKKNFHVVSYTLVKIEFSQDKTTAYQAVDIEYYRIDSMRQKTLRDLQEWTYKADSDRWQLATGLPQFK